MIPERLTVLTQAADIMELSGASLYISETDGYIYSWGSIFNTRYSPLGIELNPEETQIDMPVQVLFPAGWNN